jgi:hypothetical protein
MADPIPLERFSSSPFSGVWGNGAGGAADLTGYVMTAGDFSHPDMASLITVALTNAATGSYAGTIIWGAAIPNGRVANFRLLLTQAPGYTLPPLSVGPIYVEVS